ncbi:unnamed protein product [Rhizophagus irregularis]|nr:unnamed protein product [Rhizophagus irregularis]
MLKLPLYNTYDNKWTSMTTTGYSPARRACHSAVLTQDGRIMCMEAVILILLPVNDDLVILDTSQTVYTWSKANVISATDPPLPRCYHTATLTRAINLITSGSEL